MPELAQRLRFDLADALARHVELFADRFDGNVDRIHRRLGSFVPDIRNKSVGNSYIIGEPREFNRKECN